MSVIRGDIEERARSAEVEVDPSFVVNLTDEVVRTYRRRGYDPMWLNSGGLTPAGASLLDSLRNGEREGLPWRSHHGMAIDHLLQGHGSSPDGVPGDAPTWGALDLLITESLFQYATNLARGAVDLSVDVDWKHPRDKGPDARFLVRAAAGEDPHTLLEELRPSLPYYGRMLRALAHYRTIAESGGWETLDVSGKLEEGASGRAVGQLRERLVTEGDPVERTLAMEGSAKPNHFDPFLRKAVEHYQGRHALEPDGVVGGKTVETLNRTAQSRVDELLLNLDRLRWLPRDLGSLSVLVNVAGFELEVLEFHEPVLSMSVVVGRPEWSTTLFADTLEYVVLNPHWYVPPSIQAEETLPAIRKDPTYLEERGFDVLDRTGELVATDSLDWSSVLPGDYVIRQRPGPGNSLGRIKFIFPNEHNIYLHDTPAQSLFSRASRAFSHGCIRVEDPPGLARYIFRMATNRSPEEVAEILEHGKETTVPLNRPVPVYLVYLTSWVDQDGAVYFHPDVYDRDATLMPTVVDAMGLNAVLTTL